MEGEKVVMTRGVHQALAEFRWLTENMSKLPTRLYEIVLLQTTLENYHDAYGCMYGGTLLSGPMVVPWTPQPQPRAVDVSPDPTGAHPIAWRVSFPSDITAPLFYWGNP